jgi:hypothetical protein
MSALSESHQYSGMGASAIAEFLLEVYEACVQFARMSGLHSICEAH